MPAWPVKKRGFQCVDGVLTVHSTEFEAGGWQPLFCVDTSTALARTPLTETWASHSGG